MPSINGINTPTRAAAPSAPSAPAPSPTPSPAPTPAPSRPAPEIAPAYRSVDPRSLREEAAEQPAARENPDVDFDDMEFTDGPAAKPRGEKDPLAAENDPQPAEGVEFIMPEKPAPVEEEEEPAAEQPTAQTTGKRDYSQFDPEVAKVLSKLPNATYNAFKDKLAEWKAAADKLPQLKADLEKVQKDKPRFLAEHPKAYELQPEYSEAVQSFNEAGTEAAHWMDQLVRIKSGQSWTEWTGYDNNGKPIAVQHEAPADGKPDPRAEILVSQYLQAASSVQQQAKQTARQIAQGHKIYQESALAELNESREKFFPKMDPAKLAGDDKKFYESAMTVIPAAYKDHPLAPLLGLSFVAVRRVAAYAAKQEALVKAKNAPNTPAVGPRRAAVGKIGTDSNIVDLDAMFGPRADN